MSRDRRVPTVTSWLLPLTLILALLPGCQPASGPVFDGQRAYGFVKAQCDLGPRSAGSAGARATARYIFDQLQRLGWQPSYQDFTYRGVALQNVIARRSGTGPAIIIGAHYDTRPKADRDPLHPNDPVPGANDGASGVAVLLELARVLATPNQTVILAFFDAEDMGDLGGWEWAVGANYMAANLTEPVAKMVLLDMIGDADQQLYWEVNSDPSLRKQLWDIGASLGYAKEFIPQQKYNIIDDHIPFLRRGIPAVDIIDFDYPYWHTTQDTPDKVSPQSLERVGRVLETWLKQ
jgi:glutaminyl-peptide cyclotransferase